MRTLLFEVIPSPLNKNNFIPLMNDISQISFQFKLDLENGFIIAEQIDDNMLYEVIDFIKQHFTVLRIKEIIDISEKIEAEQKQDFKIKANLMETNRIMTREVFEIRSVGQLLNKLLRTIHWALFTTKVSEIEILNFVWTCIDEIAMKHNKNNVIPFSVGDIVECNYGTHLPGEANGRHIPSLVCKIHKNIAYIIPLSQAQENLALPFYINFTIPSDIIYKDSHYSKYVGGTALLYKGKYISSKRCQKVVGKATPEFLDKVLTALPTAFDFAKK